MTGQFSALQRLTYLKEMSEQQLDLLVIGGGITGAGIALDAQARGIKTGLIEMQDFAAGTSSRSTKLVHGGLRYLKQLDLKLVAEVGRERAIVYENAPHVTTPQWMLLPIVKGGTFGKLATSIGLKVYDLLAAVKKPERRYMLTKQEMLAKEPLLRKDILKGGGVYVEYKTDDARLTLEILKAAVVRGAVAVNYAKAVGFIYENNKVAGVKVIDVLTGQKRILRAINIVNATGPWVDTLREQDGSKQGKHLYVTKGVHIVIDRERFPLNQAVYFDTKNDGRMCFAIPREMKTYVGTTDTFYKDDLLHPRMTIADRDYLINAANYMFPEVKLTAADVESCWSGLRPLINEEGKRASEISRKDEIFFSHTGLISIAGGKLTGYRKMAKRIVDIVAKNLSVEEACSTDALKLSGGNIGGDKSFAQFLNDEAEHGIKLGLSSEDAHWLVGLYGTNVAKVYKIIANSEEEKHLYGLPKWLCAALIYGIEEEMVVSPADFLSRRTSAIFFRMKWVKQWREGIIALMQEYFCWTDEELSHHQQQLAQEIMCATTVIDESFLVKNVDVD